MSNEKRKQKIEDLKKISKRKYLIKELNGYINVSLDELLTPEETIIFRKQVYDKLDSLPQKQRIGDTDYKKNIEISIKLLNNILDSIKFKDKNVRILLSTEAVKIRVNEVFENLNIMLEKIGFLSGKGDFILVDENLDFGVCIERTEYYYELCMWGIE